MIGGWTPNTGHPPSPLVYPRVHVRLRCGRMPETPWPTTGKEPARFTLIGHPLDITHWKPA